MGKVIRFCALAGLLGFAGCPSPVVDKPPEVPVPVPETAAAGPDWGKLPGPSGEVRWSLPAVTTWSMPNGMTVWYLRQSQAPLVSLHMVFPHGAATDPVGRAGLTALTMDMLDEGAGGRDALELGETLQRLATDYGSFASTDGAVMSMGMLADQLRPSLELLADIAQRPRLPADEFGRRREQMVAQVIASQSSPGAMRDLIMRHALFNDGYLAWPSGGTQATLARLSLADVKAHYRAIVQPEGATVIVVGDVDQGDLKEALDASFGAWTGKPTAKVRAVEEPRARGVYVIDFPGATQSSITVVRRAAGVGADDTFAAEVFNWAFGGSFTGRVNMNLREDKGYSYGARSSYGRLRQAGYFAVSASVEVKATAASVQEIMNELVAVGSTRPLTDKERSDAVSGLLEGFPGRFERMDSIAGELASLAIDGRPANWLSDWPDAIRAVELSAANASAKGVAEPAAFTAVIAGDREQIGASLGELGLPVVVCDRQRKCTP